MGTVRTSLRAVTRLLFSWKFLVAPIVLVLVLLILGIWLVSPRLLAIPLGYTLAIGSLIASAILWRAYVYGNADYDSVNSFVPSGLSKSVFLLLSFIVNLVFAITVTIIDVEAGCATFWTSDFDLCQ